MRESSLIQPPAWARALNPTSAPSPAVGLWRLLRPLLFRLEAERAHQLGLLLARLTPPALVARLGTKGEGPDIARAPALTSRVMGLELPNPLGVAAGVDKDAEAVAFWQALGFGFVEVGTVTALRQPGNPRPRVFRLPRDGALINRMGFPNDGADVVATRIERLRQQDVLRVPLGINIGKSKATPAEDAAADYRRSFERLGELADFVVVNVSSPNTPGLRDLQTVEQLRAIVEAVQTPNQALTRPRPLLVKLAPDLADADALACAEAAVEGGCAGLVISNTTVDFTAATTATEGMSGGLSGAPLFARSTALLRRLRESLGSGPVLIGVGGIMDAASANAKLAAGADLIQMYTGLVYGGPGLPRALLRALAAARQTQA
ncbi:quinone-dependent dihydroorotate dehydrogenase [Thiohalocapsa halophila]|uniref:quinone-dependent dihydroorotate dehydrogenase n=1 Tax=Thiohalocapsa halophila TaxID=69359 RepID=UPI002ADD4DB4|nr:quinone-dependent dihydroorotate dehydrogenase [Thiohalocapsa halophila]